MIPAIYLPAREAHVLWTVYDHPTDYPDHYVARLWEINGRGEEVATDTVMFSDSLEWLRMQLERAGFVRIPRAELDDPKILESWI